MNTLTKYDDWGMTGVPGMRLQNDPFRKNREFCDFGRGQGVVKMRDKIFKPIPIHTENDYLSDAASEKAVSIKFPEI